MEILWQVFFKVSAYVNSPVFLRSFLDNRFYLILLVIVLMRFKYTTYRSMWMSALVNIPGTFLHELMHFRSAARRAIMSWEAWGSAILPFTMPCRRRWRRCCCCRLLFI